MLCVRTMVLALALVARTAIAHADALDLPAFTASPAALLAETRAIAPGDAPATLLLDERTSSYDAQGRVSTRWRLVFVVHDAADASDWRTIAAPWSPAHEQRPVIRARIVEPSGRVTRLDAPALVEAPATAGPGGALSDRRTVTAELPPLARGTVVEEEIVTADHTPLFAAGTVDIYPLGRDVPTRRTVLTYSAPRTRALRVVARQLPASARTQHDVVGERQRWRYALGPLPAQPYFEGDVPGDIVEQPYIGVATGASWAAVAQAYRAIIERQIAAAPVALPPELPRTPTAATVHAIAAWVAARVRYNGAELDDAALIPRTPSETVRRGAGDCKDQAALLVALLRQAGITADVALLATGLDRDVDPELPGMGSFDHAIVRVRLGSDALWLDPTEGPRRPGPLPTRDQGRRALIIADDTRALTPTPGARAEDNTVRQVRRVAMAELGPPKIVQTTQYTGGFELERRAAWRADPDAARATAQTIYVSRDVRGAATVDDLTTPFTETLEIADPGIASSTLDGLALPLSAQSVLAWLPSSIAVGRADRRQPFVWRRPLRVEVEYRVDLPDGYTFTLGPERVVPLGPATFTEQRALDGRTAVVRFRLDSGATRISARELATLREGVRTLAEAPMWLVVQPTSRALLDEHQLREAVAEAQRQVAARPRSGVAHAQLSAVLLRVAAGAAARREARAAVALEPNRAALHAQLADALLHDSLGVERGFDADRAGALATLQHAQALAPGDRRIANALAELLAADPTGRPLYGAVELAPALALRREIYARSERDDDALALAELLLFSRAYDEAERLARELDPAPARDAVLVAAIAGRAGARAALAEAAQLSDSATLREAAGWHLANMQQYPLAHALMPTAATFATLAPHPVPRADSADPRSAAIDALSSLAIPRRGASSFIDDVTEHAARMVAAKLVSPAMLRARRYAALADVLHGSRIDVEARGDAWRVAIDALGQRAILYVVRDGATAKVVGGPVLTNSLGRYALRALEAKRDEQVRALIDWLARDSSDSAMLRAAWPPGAPRSRETVLIVAAWLSAGADPAREAAAFARCVRAKHPMAPQCHWSAFFAEATLGHWRAAADHAALAFPQATPMLAGEIHALARLGRTAEANRKLAAALAAAPEDERLRLLAAELAAMRGDGDAVAQQIAALGKLPSPGPATLNDTAWLHVVLGRDLLAARELIERALRDGRSETRLHTRASIRAELGDLDGAVSDLHAALAYRVGPGDADWQIAGRIYEALGLTADAIAAYRRIAPSREPLSTYVLAQRRLAALR